MQDLLLLDLPLPFFPFSSFKAICDRCGYRCNVSTDLHHHGVGEIKKGLEFNDASKATTANLMRELPKVRLLCPDKCHSRNPRDSYHSNNHKSTKNATYEGVSDDESALCSSEMDDDGSDSDSDWEEQQEYLRKKRSGFSRGTKRKRNSSDVDTEHNIDTEDEYCLLDNGDRIESDDSPSY